ncbi:MAG: pyruvate kinase [Pseudomonadota bacterium]
MTEMANTNMTTNTWRRTKIVVTMGPSLDDPGVLEKTIAAGANVFRANFSHGTAEDHQKRIEAVREIAKKLNRHVAVFADLQGPKIRIAAFKDGTIHLEVGAEFILDAKLDDHAGDQQRVGITYKKLIDDVRTGDTLLLDDGRLVFKVTAVKDSEIICTVIVGGKLSDHKGINRQGGGLTAEALTEKDKTDLKTAVALHVDYIAISFPRSAEDMTYAKQLIKEAGGKAGVIAKIERAEAVPVIDEIIEVSDAVMVARGDLGVEIGDTELPAVQKRIIHQARLLNKPVITATQMMETMIENTIPTRAEVFDVANAVLDATDAVMLSAETATGKHPALVVKAMSDICLGTEKQPETKISTHRMDAHFNRIDEAIAMSAVYIANHLDIKAIVSLTETGSTPLWMSRIRSGTPIFALTHHEETARRVCLYRGVYPFYFDMNAVSRDHINKEAVRILTDRDILHHGDLVLITKGDQGAGTTNLVKIYRVGQDENQS